MAKDYSPVGASVTASKSASGLDGDEVFDNNVSIRQAENGGFILSASYTKKRKGNAKGEVYSGYCAPKEFAFDTFEDATAKMQELFGS